MIWEEKEKLRGQSLEELRKGEESKNAVSMEETEWQKGENEKTKECLWDLREEEDQEEKEEDEDEGR